MLTQKDTQIPQKYQDGKPLWNVLDNIVEQLLHPR